MRKWREVNGDVSSITQNTTLKHVTVPEKQYYSNNDTKQPQFDLGLFCVIEQS